jgi:hypothetical protein
MNTKSRSFFALSAIALLGAGVVASAADSTQAVAPAPVMANEAQPRPERIIYSSQLPSAAQLTQAAQAQGLAVATINQTASEITVTYRLQDNSSRTISYQLLPAAEASESTPVVAAPVQTQAPVQVVEMEPAPTVVYRYYDPYYYDPFYWSRAPISVNLGFGWGYRGGYYGGHRWGHHRHW